MTSTRISRARGFVAIGLASLAIGLIVYFGSPLLNSQARNLAAISAHIKAIEPQWRRFCEEHGGCRRVELFACTAKDGMFGAAGDIASDEDLSALRKFMEDTNPPRSVFPGALRVVGKETFDFMYPKKSPEPGGAANRSRPVSSETNRTSVAAGSGG